MYHTAKSKKLHSKALGYLELIQEANSRYYDKVSTLHRYDDDKHYLDVVRLMHKRIDLVNYISRMENLSNWLAFRLQSTLIELNQENDKQLRKVLSLNENKIMEL